jgi:tetratricopeptide (TPR) repeat protein
MAIVTLFRILTLSLFLLSNDSAYELYSIGSQLELEGKVSEAIEYYKRAQAKEPDAIEIYISLASALYTEQRFNEGIAYIEKALMIAPDNTQLYQILALGHVGRRDLGRAIEYYQRVLELEPDNQDIYLAIATLLEASREIRRAISVLEGMPVELRTADVYLKLASLAGRINDHVSAIEYYRLGYSMDTTDIGAIIGIGTGFDMIGVKDSAIYYYEKANNESFDPNIAQRLVDLYTDIDQYENVVGIAERILMTEPDNTHVRRSLGFAYYKLQRPAAAADAFYISLRYDPRDSYSAFYLARIYLEQEDYDQALREVYNAIGIDADFVELWVYLGFIAIEKKDYDLAEHAFAEAAYRGGDLSQIYYLLGAIAETQGMESKAYHYYQKSLRENARNISALQSLAGITSGLNRDEETFRIFRRILEIDTLNAVALNYVGYTYAEQNDSLDFALRLVDRALEIDRDNGYYIDSRGWILFMMGRYEDAATELKKASEIVEDAVIFEHLGDAYQKLDEPAKARDAYEKALEIEPNNRSIREKLLQLN